MSEIPYRFSQAKEHLFRTFRPQEYQRRQAFKALREKAIAQSREDLRNRLATNPQMTQFEQSLGEHVEELEPQVREAVVRMRELGYSTTLSGFWGGALYQIIQLDNTLQPATKHTLRNMGVTVKEDPLLVKRPEQRQLVAYPRSDIEFQPETPDLEAIRRKWNSIVAVLPPSGQPLLDRPRWMMFVNELYGDEFPRKNQGQK